MGRIWLHNEKQFHVFVCNNVRLLSPVLSWKLKSHTNEHVSLSLGGNQFMVPDDYEGGERYLFLNKPKQIEAFKSSFLVILHTWGLNLGRKTGFILRTELRLMGSAAQGVVAKVWAAWGFTLDDLVMTVSFSKGCSFLNFNFKIQMLK